MTPFLGEVFLSVVNDMIRAERAHQIDISRAAHASHFRTEVFGELHRKGTDTTGSAIDQYFLSWLDVLYAKGLQGDERRFWHSGGFCER